MAEQVRVRATKHGGYYGHKRRRKGECFYIDGTKIKKKDPETGKEVEVIQAFSERWMKIVSESAVDEIELPDNVRPAVPVSKANKKGKK